MDKEQDVIFVRTQVCLCARKCSKSLISNIVFCLKILTLNILIGFFFTKVFELQPCIYFEAFFQINLNFSNQFFQGILLMLFFQRLSEYLLGDVFQGLFDMLFSRIVRLFIMNVFKLNFLKKVSSYNIFKDFIMQVLEINRTLKEYYFLGLPEVAS